MAQVVRFGQNLIVARLLAPEAFGVMAIAWTVMYGLTMVSDSGIRQCIVQSKNGERPEFLNTAWTIKIARGAVLTLAAFGIAGLISALGAAGVLPPGTAYLHPDLPLVTAAVGLSAVISGLESTKLLTASRNLALVRVTSIDIACQVLGLVVTVAWALVNPTIWALVAGVFIVGPTRALLTHLVLPGTPNRWLWHGASAREILGFGKWIVLSSALGFLVASGDRILLGGLIDANLLGQYSIAFLIVGSTHLVIGAIVANVALPALSEVYRTRPEALRSAFYRLRTPIDLLSLSLLGFLATAGSALIDFLYDDRYGMAGPLVQILALSLFAVRFETATQCYLAMGRSKFITPATAVRLVPLALTPAAFHLGGFSAAAWCIAFAPLASIPVHLYLMRKIGVLNLWRELIVLPVIGAGALVGLGFVMLGR